MKIILELQGRARSLRFAVCVIALALSGCASTQRAPVETRTPHTPPVDSTAPVAPPASSVTRQVQEEHYVVKPGDTLVRIGLESGQDWRDLARWNNIDNPDVIEVGQALRISPPPGEAQTRPVASARIDGKPLDAKAAAAASAPVVAAAAPASDGTGTGITRVGEDDIRWSWPAAAPVNQQFDPVRNKGLGLAGKRGDAIYAAGDGRVIYANAGLRGYGNLVIIQHAGNYVTAYAHNDKLLVKEDQLVKRGQKIAEMGSSDADSVGLHFELRRAGKPLDPAKVLPPR